jgi:transcriptional regulator with XRE-family HTH domain
MDIPDKKDMTLARNVARARRKLGMTQAEFARAMAVSRASASDWERGGPGPSLRHLRKIAKISKTPLADLVG